MKEMARREGYELGKELGRGHRGNGGKGLRTTNEGSGTAGVKGVLEKALDRRRRLGLLRSLSTRGEEQVDFCSNDYLGLARSFQLEANVRKAQHQLRSYAHAHHHHHHQQQQLFEEQEEEDQQRKEEEKRGKNVGNKEEGLSDSTISPSPRYAADALLGSSGSRLLTGNSDFAETVERRIAAFHESESALLFNSVCD